MTGFLLRLRDVIDRGRLDIGQLRLADVVGWLLTAARGQGGAPVADLCSALEAAARLALLKARHLDGHWQTTTEDEEEPWLGPPPELPVRRSWLGERIASGPLSFVAGTRTYESVPPALAPIAPERLRAAYLAVLNRQRKPETVTAEPRPPRLSMEACTALIVERLQAEGEIRLQGIAGDSRDAHVAAFLSCLILAREGRVVLEQDAPFADIVVRPATAALDASA
jgi:chromatin segregation and condensation protein Rec8/ScpA/Scc1 (kleisin family)